MAIADIADLIAQVDLLMGASSTLLSTSSKTQAANQTVGELGWEVASTDEFKCFWLIERTKRHIMYVRMLESADKFRFKQIHLQQRFANYVKLIENLDEAFKEAVEDNPNLFPTKTNTWAGDFYGAGFIYDQVGRDLTYL